MYMYVDLKGTIIICSRGSYTPVHVVTATGEQHKFLLTSEITKPMCVDFRPSDGTLEFGTSDNAYLTVFQIKLDQERIVRRIRFSIQLWQSLTPILLNLNNWYIWEPVLENEQLKGIIFNQLATSKHQVPVYVKDTDMIPFCNSANSLNNNCHI